MFCHISLTLDLLFDNLTIPLPSMHEFGLTIQAIKSQKFLWHWNLKYLVELEAMVSLD